MNLILIIHVLLLNLLFSGSYGTIYYLNELTNGKLLGKEGLRPPDYELMGDNETPTHQSDSVYEESEYDRMPPIYKLDSYNSCLQESSDVYCSVSFHLVSDEPNELLHIIKEYSKQTPTHFNDTQLRYGICVKESCQKHVQDTTTVSETILETCLNDSLWEGYQLKTRIDHFTCYRLSNNNIKIDASDVVVGLIVFVIIVLNIVGSLIDVCYSSKKNRDKSIILNFSIKRNWMRLISTTSNCDPRVERLKGLNGLRSIIMFGVIGLHCVWPFVIAVENSHEVELTYYSVFPYIFFNGPIMMQAFFLMSGFLLAYNIELISEKQQINWRLVPQGIFIRYLRLTPVYALVIAFTATWLKFLGPGPIWETAAAVALNDCRTRWWLNLLYLHNLVYNSQCLMHTWYLAADMQLCCFGLILCVLLKSTRLQTTVLIIPIIVGIIITAVQTYVRDLDATVILSPSSTSSILDDDRTYNEIYKMAHGNLSTFVIGLALAHIVYKFQNNKIDGSKLQKLKQIYWAVLPLIFAVFMSCAVFYRDAPRDPLYIRVLHAAFAKPVMGSLIAIFIAGMIFKLESVYRNFFEWRLWTIPSRLSYSVFIVHFPFLLYYVSMQTSLYHSSGLNIIKFYLSITIVSFMIAVLLYLLVEAPFTGLTKYIIPGREKTRNDVKDIRIKQIKHD